MILMLKFVMKKKPVQSVTLFVTSYRPKIILAFLLRAISISIKIPHLLIVLFQLVALSLQILYLVLILGDMCGHIIIKKQDSYSRIDYILASPKMFSRFIPNSGWIEDENGSESASDHRLIYADFRI